VASSTSPLVGFFLLAAGMATLTLALDGQKGLGISSLSLAALVAIGVISVLWYLWHARGNDRALFSLSLFQNATYRLGLLGSFAGRVGSGMLPFMTPVFLQIGLGFSPFHAGLMMIPMVLGSMGMKRIVGAPLFDPATARRHFRIAMSDYAARIVLPPLLMILRESAPGFDLAISQASREMMLAQLEDGDVDLALGVFPTATNDIQRETLFPEQFICLADKRFLPANGKLTLEEWLEKPSM
jgi:hypothetical protein